MTKKQYDEIGQWWNNGGRDIPLIAQDGEVYACYGWNGEKYTDCWKVGGEYYHDVLDGGRVYDLRPEYDWDAWNEEDEVFLDENGEEWDGIIRYHIGY